MNIEELLCIPLLSCYNISVIVLSCFYLLDTCFDVWCLIKSRGNDFNKGIKYLIYDNEEEYDKEQMLQFMKNNENYLERENQVGHFTASMWVVNKERTKTLMVYHNLYDSWSWIGGHADGMENLCEVALKELREETGVESVRLISEDVFSLETLAVSGHMQWMIENIYKKLIERSR